MKKNIDCNIKTSAAQKSARTNKKSVYRSIALLLLCILLLIGCGNIDTIEGRVTDETFEEYNSDSYDDSQDNTKSGEASSKSDTGQDSDSDESSKSRSGLEQASDSDYNSGIEVLKENLPEYSDDPYVAINGNTPYFTESDLTTSSYESYSSLDGLGRCGVCIACVGQDIMPTEERGSISQVKPTGWHSVEYDCVDGGSLYNRCHLLGFQLTGENANERNLITGTRYMNVDGMLPFENMVADYVKETDNHVLYRVTPIFDGNNLIASGVLMEAMSVEDAGEELLFNVYCYNVQPGIEIDYATGDSVYTGNYTSGNQEDSSTGNSSSNKQTYVLNTNTCKFHYPSCSSVSKMSASNKKEYTGTRDEVISMGYEPCGNCNP